MTWNEKEEAVWLLHLSDVGILTIESREEDSRPP